MTGQTTLKPIQTSYKGYRFRSRLEARWAVVFDALDIPWVYEPEGYDLPSGYYLPDFRIRPLDGGGHPLTTYVEVKGDLEGLNWDRFWEFSTRQALVIVGDIPEPMPDHPPALFPMLVINGEGNRDPAWIAFDYQEIWGIPTPHPRRTHIVGTRLGTESRRAAAAFRAGRSARFEHGETP